MLYLGIKFLPCVADALFRSHRKLANVPPARKCTLGQHHKQPVMQLHWFLCDCVYPVVINVLNVCRTQGAEQTTVTSVI